ncbi:MAG TPA: hypothetical protein VNY24_08595 [Candidatus Acidoferrales bacterium]|jgi:hypothetical protein|nr:hypothetical protein [Candidatus Acidoferrales bacterium]
MAFRFISRRRFIENSVSGGLAVGLGLGVEPLRATASAAATATDGLALKVTGDAKQGYGVALLFNGQPVARHNQGGEFSAIFQNEDRSVEDRVENWKANSWTGDAARMTLSGECKLKNLNATVFLQVEYERITPRVVRKKIRLRQSDMFLLFYQLSNRLEATGSPAKLWSFDQLNWQGEAAHEYFPAAGFRMKNGLCVGLLTDSGYRNQWTRIVRRDGKPVKPAPARIPDANLYIGSSPAERGQGNFFVQQTFGELTQQISGEDSAQPVPLSETSSWKRLGEATLEQREGVVVVSARRAEDGVIIPITVDGAAVLSIRMEYRSAAPVAIQVWKVDGQLRRLDNITLYNDVAPESHEAWGIFETTVFVPGSRAYGRALFLSVAPSEQGLVLDVPGVPAKSEVRGLQIRRIATCCEPYHRLEMDRPEEKTVFVFADEAIPDTIRGHRLASQLNLADGLDFKGGDTEKVVYADLMMLTWIAGPESFRPILAPSIWYSAAGEMYLRDSFFALSGIHNQKLNESVFGLWGENQGSDGSINTLLEPNLANVERKSNDSTPLWLMWALLNHRRFGASLPMDKVRKAAEYCLQTYDPRRESVCHAQFVLGQLDIIRYSEGTSAICENQGMLAVTLRTIKELQIPGVSEALSEEYIGRAEALYRSYYDPTRKFMRPARDIADAIGFAEIFPEYLSLWLFKRKILTDEMVVNHLDRIPALMPRNECPHPEVGGTVRPILIGLPEGRKDGSYFTSKWHPMVSDSFAVNYANRAMDGIYYNGGSWMRIEICGYVTGLLHGWNSAKKAIANRLWAELNISPDFPTSQEYLATDPAHPFFGYHRVFAWNSFVLQALELAGLRSPGMDPDYKIGSTNL